MNTKAVYETLLTHMDEAVWMGDESERTIFANPKFCELTGYSLKDMIGKESYFFWDEESAKKVKATNKQKRRVGISSSYEGNLVRKDGKKVPVIVRGTPLPYGGTIGILTDLSELKRRESIYEKLITNMNEAVWMGDKNERTIYANPRFCELMEYTLEEMLGRESYDFWDPESAARVQEINETKRGRGVSSSYEGNLLTKSGKKIPVFLSGSPLPDGGTIGIMTDLRELKKKEKSEKILNKAIQYSSDAIITFQQCGEIDSWNKGAKLIFGYKSEEIVGKKLEMIFDQSDVEEMMKNGEILYNFELKSKHKNGQELLISATLTPVYQGSDSEKVVSFYLIIGRDITHQSKFEEELSLKYKKIQDAYNRFGIIRRQMDYVFELLDMCSSNRDMKSLADYIVSSIIMLTKVDACVLRKHDRHQGLLELMSSFGLASDWESKSSIKYEKSLVQRAFQQQMPLKIIDLAKEPQYQSKHLAKKNQLSSLLLIPLRFKGELVGSLSLYARPDKKLEIFENEFIEKYAKLIEIVIARMD